VTIGLDRTVRAAVAGAGEAGWTAIRYPQAVWDDDGQCWISDAEVAHHPHAARRHPPRTDYRLGVRRVHAATRPGETELFPAWRYHAFLTDTDPSTVDADRTHRAHAVIEQTFADLIDGPLAHLPATPSRPSAGFSTVGRSTESPWWRRCGTTCSR
jgi:hypothetical protein